MKRGIYMSNLISVIIPVFNKEMYIENSIKSVISQTHSNFELIVIDDGSTDQSAKVINEIKNQENEKIKYFFQSNKGVSAARNYGLSIAKGKYICFLDADDLYLPTFLEEMLMNIGDKNVIYCGSLIKKNEHVKKNNITFLNGDIMANYLLNSTTPNTNSWMIKKDLIDKHNIYFPLKYSIGEDMIFFSKILFYDKEIIGLNKHLTIYNSIVLGSLTYNIGDKIKEDLEWMEDLIEFIYKNEKNNLRKIKLTKAIKSYRIPASIIYKIQIMNGDITKKRNVFLFHQKSFNNFKFNNGIRSIKLYLNYILLRRKLKLGELQK